MPGNAVHPLIAILGQFDASQWANVNVYDRGADHITVDATAGVFSDPIDFFSGRGSQTGRDLGADLQSRWTANAGAGLIEIGINSADKVYIETDTESFDVDGAGALLLGFSAAQLATLVGGVAPYRLTAANDWTRGVLAWPSTGRVLVTPAVGTSATVPRYTSTVQSLPAWLRSVSESDVDGVWSVTCLESADNTAADNTDRRIRWGINDSGYVYTTRPTGVAAAVTWVSATFRNRLGFTGSEAEVTADGLVTLTAANPLPGCYFPTRPLETIERITRETTGTLDLSDGDISSNHVASIGRWRIVFFVDGPADSRDTSRHWVERCVRDYWHKGTMLTLYQHVGETRRALAGHLVNAEQVAYDLLYTSERDGYRGRLRCRIAGDAVNERALAWEAGLRRRLPVELVLVDAT